MREKLNEARREAEDYIRKILKIAKVDYLNLRDLCDTPILQEDAEDCDNTFTLDAIICNGNGLRFIGSSAYDNGDFGIETISSDALIEIAEWIKDNLDEIAEYIKEDMTEDEIFYMRYRFGSVSYEAYLEVCELQECEPEPPVE